MLDFFCNTVAKDKAASQKKGLPKADRRNNGAAHGLHLKAN
jgi:hypothetical protein